MWKVFISVVLCLTLFIDVNSALASGLAEEYFIFQQNDKKGVRNSDHEIVIPAEYDDLGWSIGEFHPLGQILGYQENGLWGLITLKNKKIAPAQYRNLYPLNRQLIIATTWDQVHKRELFGIIDLNGQVVLGFEYGWLNMFNNLIVSSRYLNGEWKYGIMDVSFQEVLPFKYQQIKTLNNKFAIIVEHGKSGLVDASGQVVVTPAYDEIELQGNEFRGKLLDTYEIKNEQNQLLASLQLKNLHSVAPGVIVAIGLNSSQLLNAEGAQMTKYQSREILDFVNGKAVIKSNDFYGVINRVGKEILPAQFSAIWLTEDHIGVQESNGWWKILGSDLKEITTRKYQQIEPGADGLFPVKRLDRWGFVNADGEEVIPPQYEQVSGFKEHQAFAFYLGSWGVIDHQGSWLVKPRFDKLKRINNSVFLFQSGNDFGIVDTSNGIVYQSSNRLEATETGIIESDNQGQHGLISFDGEKMLSVQYSSITPFKEDQKYYKFHDETGLGIFNIEKRTFFSDTTMQEIRTLNEDYIGVQINNQYGFIDLNGKLRIANRYQDVGVFSEDMLAVKIRGRWGYVDRLERLKVQPVYQSTGLFKNELAIVSKDQKFGLIDKTGKVILSLDYERIERLADGHFICYQRGKAGLVASDGRVLFYPAYDWLELMESGHVKISKNGKQGVVTKQGKSLIPAQYHQVVFDDFNNLYLLTKQKPWSVIKI